MHVPKDKSVTPGNGRNNVHAVFFDSVDRFTSRRPGVRKMYSDCGSNFKGAEAELKRAVEAWNSLASAGARVTNLKWIFLPPMDHHRAGVWERLIKSVKKHINSVGTIGQSRRTSDTASTSRSYLEF